ncbi:hypothetical protein V8D89_008047 [Ganoderma adspersum]
MLKVLVHHHGAPANAPFYSKSLFHLLLHLLSQPLLLSFLLFTFAAISLPPVAAADEGIIQAPKDINGLSVIDSPAPNSVLHTGSNLSIAIDVSASNSGTFSYRSLEVYLVSATVGKNITISNGTQLLTQEPASTVKHINWPIATCLEAGEYNLTVYEASTLTSNGTSYFAIMPVLVEVQNNGVPDDYCASALNVLQAQPQASNPPPVTLIPGRVPSNNSAVPSRTATNTDTATATPAPTDGQVITVTAGDGDITIPLTDLPGTIVVEPSGGAPPDPTSTDMTSGFTTIFKTVAPTATETLTEIISQPITVTFKETFVSTVTGPGQTEEFTVTQTLISTVELIQTQVSSPEEAGLLPVNEGMRTVSPLSAFTMLSFLSGATFLFILHPAFVL